MIPNPLAPRTSIYSDDIPHTYHANDVAAGGNACEIPHTVGTPEIVEAVVTHGGDAMDSTAAVIADFTFYWYMVIFITVIMIIGFLLDWR